MDIRERSGNPVGNLIRKLEKYNMAVCEKHVLPSLALEIVPPGFGIRDIILIILPFPVPLDDFVDWAYRDGPGCNGYGSSRHGRIGIGRHVLRPP
jgi:hypothetical protein